MKMFESEFVGKTVMSDEGMVLGTLRGVQMNEENGELVNVLVEPAQNIDVRLYHQDRGYIVFPFGAVKSVRDFVVVGSH
ncbi:MAG: PRC-barrel domain protein [Thermoplasmata archaeon HGW-Thermoplasmata-2]|nr:MAG: PRC-barrel domain protein [Thermoplasmata archaeon HGW-Thermoplasmata-2]